VDEVIEIEGVPDYTELPGFIGYEREVVGIPTFTYFTFFQGTLVQGLYIFQKEYVNPQSHIRDYERVFDALTSVYGDPIFDDREIDELYRNDVGQWGFAISAGRGSFSTAWQTESTRLVMNLAGENFKVSFFLQYSDRARVNDYLDSQKAQRNEGL
jgi:hypothetical protein